MQQSIPPLLSFLLIILAVTHCVQDLTCSSISSTDITLNSFHRSQCDECSLNKYWFLSRVGNVIKQLTSKLAFM